MNRLSSNRARAAVAIVLAMLLLSACTITTSVTPRLPIGRINIGVGSGTSDIITSFSATRGAGATYYIGDPIEFTISTRSSGYVTLSYLDSGGNVGVFARNIQVPGGTVTIRAPAGSQFQVTGPTGPMYVRAAFTSGRTDGSVAYSGRLGHDGWNSRLSLDLRTHSQHDVVQTWVTVR